jgi:hypothetical protein
MTLLHTRTPLALEIDRHDLTNRVGCDHVWAEGTPYFSSWVKETNRGPVTLARGAAIAGAKRGAPRAAEP